MAEKYDGIFSWGFILLIIACILLPIAAFGFAFAASRDLITTPTVAISATIAANNRTASSLISAGGWVILVTALMVLLLALFASYSSYTGTVDTVFTPAMYEQYRIRWGYLFLVFAFLLAIVAGVLVGLGIGYIDGSTNNNSGNARTFAFIAVVLIFITFFLLFFVWWSIYSYNSFLFGLIPTTLPTQEIQGIDMLSIAHNPKYPKTILEQKITVDSKVQDLPTTVLIDGKRYPSNETPRPYSDQKVFTYTNVNGQLVPKAEVKKVTVVEEKQLIAQPAQPVRRVTTTTPTTTVQQNVPVRRRNIPTSDVYNINGQQYVQNSNGGFDLVI